MEINYCDWMVIGGRLGAVGQPGYITQAKFKTIAYSLALIPPSSLPSQLVGRGRQVEKLTPDLTWTSTSPKMMAEMLLGHTSK
jgi:hypothetical protein